MDPFTAFLITHKTEIYYGVMTFVALSVSKFPDPRRFETRWWHPAYYAFFTIATWVSGGEWNKWGGKFKFPFFSQEPKLENTPHPLYTKPDLK